MLKPYRFSTGPVGFKLVVLAYSERSARDYVKCQAMSSITHRALKFEGVGHPPNPENWCAATVRE